jgi:hypothetical protein
MPEQLFIHRGNSGGLFSWNMNSWNCSHLRYAAPGTSQTPESQSLPTAVQMDVFPNPADQQLSARIFIGDKTGLAISVTSVVGQELLRKQVGEVKDGEAEFQLDLGELSPGVYFVSLVNEDGKLVTKRVMVQR